MNKSKQHHFVPRFILKGFRNSRGELYIFDKRSPENYVKQRSIEKAFMKFNLNSFRNEDGIWNDDLERKYSMLEDAAAPIVKKIITQATIGKKPDLTKDERDIWDEFIYRQQLRSPEFFKQLGYEQKIKDDVARAIKELEKENKPPTDKEKSDVQDNPEQFLQMIRVITRSNDGGEAITALAKFGVGIAIIKLSNKSFIVGDHFPLFTGPATSPEPWIPISSKVAIRPAFGPARSEHLVELDRQQICRINETVFRNSNIVGGPSKELVQSLANRR
ncbi:MAG: DUF4238 domain-containing protein [Sneathiella sp.]